MFCAGCASYKPFPPGFLKAGHTARVVVRQMPARPQMIDSGNGGIIGAVITATSRANRMREQLTGLRGEDVQETLLEEFDRRMGEHLKLDSTDSDLRLEITVLTWGWFVPTIDFGIKVGEYQSQLIGRVEVFDTVRNKKIAYAHLEVARPIGLKPEEEVARAAVAEVARAFATQAEEALVHSVKQPQIHRYF